MAIDLVALNTEIQTDPLALGYIKSPTGTRDQKLAALSTNATLLNNQNQSSRVRRGLTPSSQVMAAVVGSELVALSAARQSALQLYISAGDVDLSSDNVRAALQSIFAGATVTLSNLATAQDRPRSRAEVLFGDGTVVKYSDVGQALGV